MITNVILLCFLNVLVFANGLTTFERPSNHAKIARYLVHKSNWGAAGTLSTNNDMRGLPMVNIISIADSARGAPSTGNIYFMLTTLDFTGQDIKINNKITFMISNDEDLSCSKDNNTDPMEPTCARVILSGDVKELTPNDGEEYEFAKFSFDSRHPAAVHWNAAHTFFLCKLDISNIFVLDWYGGPHEVSPDLYYNTNPDDLFEETDNTPFTSSDPKVVNIKIKKHKYKSINIILD